VSTKKDGWKKMVEKMTISIRGILISFYGFSEMLLWKLKKCFVHNIGL